MRNIQKVWILHATVLSLNFLVAKRHWIVKTPRFNKPIYFKNILSKKVCHFGEEVLFLFPQEVKGCGFIRN